MIGFIKDYLWNVVISLLILLVGSFLVSYGKGIYYTYAPIDTFFENTEFRASDVCQGDTTQLITSTRFVKGTAIGYAAEVHRELFLVEIGAQIKVFDEESTPFIEYIEDGRVARIQQLPEYLRPGDYQWVLKVRIAINGVVRDDVPLIYSNVFKVKPCTHQ